MPSSTIPAEIPPTEAAGRDLHARGNPKTAPTPATFVISTTLDGIITSLSGSAADLLGYQPEEIIGRTSFDYLLAPAGPAAAGSAAGVDFESLASTARSVGHITLDCTLISRQGDPVPACLTIALVHGSDGNPLSFLIVGNDLRPRIAEAERASLQAAALRRSEEQLILALDATGIGIWDWDISTDQVHFSPQWKAMLGYAPHEIQDSFEAWKRLWHPDDEARILKCINDHLSGVSESYYVAHRLRHKDGTWRWILALGKMFPAEQGLPVRWVGAHVDITARREVENRLQEMNRQLELSAERAQALAVQAQSAAAAKAEFLANMSHEIRTPMNAVVGMTELLETTDLDPTQADYVSTIRTSGESMLALINDILDFSKIESGKLDLEIRPVELAHCLQTALELTSRAAELKGLYLKLEIDELCPKHFLGDVTRIRQILVNLVSNAVKFTERGGVQVRVSREILANSDRLIFSVHDTGIGIPPDRMDRLFKSFSQVDSSTARNYGGTGLGLAICHRLVTLMGGTIRVTSKPSEGSCFSFEIPCKEVGLHCTLPDRPRRPIDLPLTRDDLTILVADDVPINQRVALLMLKKLGLRAEVASNGLEALEALTRRAFDVVLMDVQMPELDGVAAARRIRETLPDPLRPWIIAMTASVLPQNKRICLDAGMDDFLAKPVTGEGLAACLERAIEGLNTLRAVKIA
jgi:PAS domain S-box-containing protein